MALSEGILTKRIPTPPFGDVGARRVVGFDEYARSGGYKGLRRAMDMGEGAVVDMVKASGLRGRGGAGFGTGMKWTFLPEADGERRYLAVNADEAEPGTFKDRLIIEFDPHLLLEGIAICCYACGLDTAYIYIRGEYHLQAKVLQRAIDGAYANGIFGERSVLGEVNGRVLNCYIHRGAGAYVCGEETGLLESLEGKRGWPRVKPPFPAVEGLFGRPTVINNVETLALLGSILVRGVDWFRSMGRGSEFGEGVAGSYGPKLFGVSGHVNRPGVYEEELGISMGELIENYAMGMKGGKKFKAAIPGGVAMGFLGADEFGTELDFDIGRRHDVMGLGTGGVIVMDEGTDMVAVVRNIVRFFARESCGQCTPCREGCDWAYKILCRIERGEGRMKDLDVLMDVAGSMGAIDGLTICGLADGTNWVIRTAMEKFRDEFEARCRASLVGVG